MNPARPAPEQAAAAGEMLLERADIEERRHAAIL